jgi:hypothetical protein
MYACAPVQALKGWGCSKAECGHFVRTAKALLTEAGAVPEPPSATSSSSTGAEEAGADGTGQLKSNKQRATDSSTSSSSAKPRAQGSALRSSTGGAIPLRASTGGGLPASNSAAAVGGRAGSSAVPRNGRLASATGASGALTSGPSEVSSSRCAAAGMMPKALHCNVVFVVDELLRSVSCGDGGLPLPEAAPWLCSWECHLLRTSLHP